MQVFSTEQQAMMKSLQETGEFASESAVLDEALELLWQRNQLRRQLQVASEELRQGQGIPAEDAIRQLQAELNQSSP